MAFCIDLNKYMLNNACYILTGLNLEYLLSILNSKITTWYSFITNMNKTGVGDVQVGRQNVILFSIPLLSKIKQKPFVNLVTSIIKNKSLNLNTQDLETELDNIVYKLYGLTDEEIDIINRK
jgi:hypothetical protein